jgi:hypothetical protein
LSPTTLTLVGCTPLIRDAITCNSSLRLLRKTLTIPGKDGDDVPLYLEKQLAQLLSELEELREDEDS